MATGPTLGIVPSMDLGLVAAAAVGWFAAAPVEIEVAGPSPLILGDVAEVEVLIRAPETEAVAGRPLRLSVNVGRFGPVERLASGEYRARYRLPETRFPQVALVAAWRETGPDADIRFFRIPLHGRTDVPVEARRGAEVSIKVGDETFGPVAARRGRAVIPIVVPPGVGQVTVTSVRGPQRSQAEIATGVPPYNRLTLALAPYKVRSDGESHAMLHVYVDRDPPVGPSSVSVSAPSGRVRFVDRQGPRLRYRYTPDRAESAGSVVIKGRVRKDRASKAAVEVELGLPIPERLVPRMVPERWVADGETEYDLQVLLTDRLGLGVDGFAVEARADPAQVREVQPEGNGRYRIRLAPLAPSVDVDSVRIDLRVARESDPDLESTVELPVDPPPWPGSLELERALGAGDPPPVYAAWVARDLRGRPFEEGGFEITVDEGVQAGPIETTEPGRYRSRLTADRGRDRVNVRVRHDSGRIEAEQTLSLRRTPRRFELGARAGPLFSEGVFFLGGAELGVRLPLWEDRVRVRFRASYFQRQRTFDGVLVPGDDPVEINGVVRMVPLAVGAEVDMWRRGPWRAYGSAYGVVGLAFSEVETTFDGAVDRSTSVNPGVEGAVGAAWSWLFVETAVGYLPVDEDNIEVPELIFSITAGARYALF